MVPYIPVKYMYIAVHAKIMKNRNGEFGDRWDFINKGLFLKETDFCDFEDTKEKEKF
jgi:hypothetical protein